MFRRGQREECSPGAPGAVHTPRSPVLPSLDVLHSSSPWQQVKRWPIYAYIPGETHFCSALGSALRHCVSLYYILWIAPHAHDGMAALAHGVAHPACVVPHPDHENEGDLSPVALVSFLFCLTGRPECAFYGTYRADDPDPSPGPQRITGSWHYWHARPGMGSLRI